MNFIKKHLTVIILFLTIIFLYFIFRLPNLTVQPIFADEAIYVRWAQVMRAEPTLRFLPLSDGKTPLFMWALMPMLKVIDDPLYAGRLLSVICGLFTLIGVFFLGIKFFNKRVGLWAAFLIAVTPYIVFFDRMALVDTMLSAFTIWSLFLALWLIKNPRLDLAMFLGYALGFGILAKTPGMFNLLNVPLTLITFSWVKQNQSKKLLKLFGLWIIAIVISMAIYNMLRLGSGFNNLSSRNQDYTHSPLILLQHPLDPFIPHLRDVWDWFPKLFTIPIFIVCLLGIAKAIFSRNKILWVIILWSLTPFVIETALLKTFTARYLLFCIPPLLFIGGWFIDTLIQKWKKSYLIKATIILLVLLPWVTYFNFLLVTNPQEAPLPRESKRGYFEDWTAGYNLKEIAQFLIKESEKGPVVVGTEGFFGTLPDGLQIYLDKDDIAIIGGKAEVTDQLRNATKNNAVYFVGNKLRMSTIVNRMNLIKEYQKAKPMLGGEQDAIVLYQVLP